MTVPNGLFTVPPARSKLYRKPRPPFKKNSSVARIIVFFPAVISRASTITPMKHSAIINVPGTTIAHSSEKPIRYSDVDRLSVRKGYDSR